MTEMCNLKWKSPMLSTQVARWQKILNDENSSNAIWVVMHRLTTNLAVLRGYQAIHNDTKLQSSLKAPLLENVVIASIFYAQVMLIRRLLDNSTDVNSLSVLYGELKKQSFDTEELLDIHKTRGSVHEANMKLFFTNILSPTGKLKKQVTKELNKRLVLDRNKDLADLYTHANQRYAHSVNSSNLRHELAVDISKLEKIISDVSFAFYAVRYIVEYTGLRSLVVTNYAEGLIGLNAEETKLMLEAFKTTDEDTIKWQNEALKLIGVM